MSEQDTLSEETINKFTKGAEILAVQLYEKDGHLHLLLSNGAILTIQAVSSTDGMPERLRVGILGPDAPERPENSPAPKPGERRRVAARAAKWERASSGTGAITHVFWDASESHMRTLCGRRYSKEGLVLRPAHNAASHCRMCKKIVNSVRK